MTAILIKKEVIDMLSAKTYFKITATIFFVVGLMHLLRLLNGWEVVLGGYVIPFWASIIGVCAAWFLSYSAYSLSSKKSKK